MLRLNELFLTSFQGQESMELVLSAASSAPSPMPTRKVLEGILVTPPPQDREPVLQKGGLWGSAVPRITCLTLWVNLALVL